MTFSLAALSDSLSRLVALGAPLLTAIRIGPNRHVTGLLCPGGAIVTTDQALPALETYTIVLPNRSLVPAYAGLRIPASNLAVLHLNTAVPAGFPDIGTAVLGGLALVLGAAGDASPTVRLTVVHRFLHTADGPAAVLDLPAAALDPGSPVFNADGRLIGLAAPGPNDAVIAIPGVSVSRAFQPNQTGAKPTPPPYPPQARPAAPAERRGWLGVALQPITVPDQLAARAGQTSGRMVVTITTGGPADRAGLRIGDVLLSLNGTSIVGQHGLRSVLAEERIGRAVDVRLLRDGAVVTTHLTISEQP
jgi:hypothetical protein